jgi:hypothetical protein
VKAVSNKDYRKSKIISIPFCRASAYKIKEKSSILGMVYWEGAMKEEQSPPMTPLMTYFSIIQAPDRAKHAVSLA